MVIVLDNCSTHIDKRVREAVQAEGHLICFQPPYSSDINPIKLTFQVVKAWIKRHYRFLRPLYHSFGDFLQMATVRSRCNRFARTQFRHAAGGVCIEQEELDQGREQLRA